MKERTLKDWIIATRPWSFTASLMPVLVTLAYLFLLQCTEGVEVDWVAGWLTLPMMLFMHAGGNLVSDYSDNVKQIDLPGSLNGVDHIYSGKFTPKEILYFGWALLAVGALLGVGVVALSTVRVLWIGALGILLCFALLPSVGVSMVATSHYHPETLLLALTYGTLTVAILHANNTRDILNDRRAHLRTLAGLLGGILSQVLYVQEIVLPYLLVFPFVLIEWLPWTIFAVWLTAPLALRNIWQMKDAMPEGEQDISTLDQRTAQLQMAYALLLALSLAVGGWLF